MYKLCIISILKGNLYSPCQVTYRPPPANWSMLGGLPSDEQEFVGDEKNFFYQKWYDAESARFVDPLPECCYDDSDSMECHSCVRTKAKEMVCYKNTVSLDNFRW